jgi:predicted transcriptional regulator
VHTLLPCKPYSLSLYSHDMSSLDLKQMLRDAGLSQFDLARSSGVHPSQISRACSGMQLSDDAQRRVLEVLNPPTDTMTTGTKVVTSE